jgi:hypothetical protein
VHAAHQAGLKTAAITWPVTVDAAIDFNLPEYFQNRREGSKKDQDCLIQEAALCSFVTVRLGVDRTLTRNAP